VPRVNLTFALHALPRASSQWRLRLRPESRRNESGGSVQAPRTDQLSDGPGLLAVANVTLELPPCSTRTVTRHPLTPAATHRVRHVGINRAQTGRGRHQYVSSAEAKDRRSHGRVVPRVSLTGKGPGASVAEYPLYVRAGKARERERDPLKGPLRHPLDTPAPPRFWSIRCSCGWVWRVLAVRVCVRRTLRPPRCVSTGPVVVRLAGMAI